ncbi:hypothetical protein BLOT_005390 [Blomia tropicalis]|nr:hypothetical protein BLOT_005390 [Blomia tropicalis]
MEMFALVFVTFIISSHTIGMVQSHPMVTSPSPFVPIKPNQLKANVSPAKSLRDLFFSGLFVFRLPTTQSDIDSLDENPVPEIETNELSADSNPSFTTILPTVEQPTEKPTTERPKTTSIPIMINSRLSSMRSLDKAIISPIPIVHTVSSDQVVKKTIFTSPKLSDTIENLTFE